MKIVAALSCYNEALFLDYAIASIYNYVDFVVLNDQAFKSVIDAGMSAHSQDGTQNIIDKWVDNKKIFFVEHKTPPNTFGELMNPCLEKGKELGADYYMHVGGDEIWPEECGKFLKPYLNICEKKGILGLNLWMNIFAPDMWHCRDFRNPRIGKITKDCYVGRDGDALVWPDLNLYQIGGNCEELYPPGTPEHIKKVNGDFPKNLRPFHYSCVGNSRVEGKVAFWQKINGTHGDRYNKAYIDKDWKKFEEYGYKTFTGKHPPLMEKHPLFKERLY